MKRINFNDRYGLTQAVIEGRKTMKRQIVNPQPVSEMRCTSDDMDVESGLRTRRAHFANGAEYLGRYKIGEVVVVAQGYRDVAEQIMSGDYGDDLFDKFRTVATHLSRSWTNKMYVAAELMPHCVRFTDIRWERLQDISDEECRKEGIRYVPEIDKFYFEDMRRDEGFYFDNHREAFAALIDKVSGKGTWERNPWVFVYEFELVK